MSCQHENCKFVHASEPEVSVLEAGSVQRNNKRTATRSNHVPLLLQITFTTSTAPILFVDTKMKITCCKKAKQTGYRTMRHLVSEPCFFSLIFVVNIFQCVVLKIQKLSSVFSIKFFFYFNFKSMRFTTVDCWLAGIFVSPA
jgi:hypothetical protein